MIEYRQNIKQTLENESIAYRILRSRDSQRTRSTNVEYSDVSKNCINALNKILKEPSEIVLFSGGIYEYIVNDLRGGYNQSQMAFLIDLPYQQTVDRFVAIPLWIAPPGTQIIQFDYHNILTIDKLKEKGWNEVSVGVTPVKIVNARGGLQAKILQYSLKHIGAIKLNKSQNYPLAVMLLMKIP